MSPNVLKFSTHFFNGLTEVRPFYSTPNTQTNTQLRRMQIVAHPFLQLPTVTRPLTPPLINTQRTPTPIHAILAQHALPGPTSVRPWTLSLSTNLTIGVLNQDILHNLSFHPEPLQR
jgi:hypothetical protein